MRLVELYECLPGDYWDKFFGTAFAFDGVSAGVCAYVIFEEGGKLLNSIVSLLSLPITVSVWTHSRSGLRVWKFGYPTDGVRGASCLSSPPSRSVERQRFDSGRRRTRGRAFCAFRRSILDPPRHVAYWSGRAKCPRRGRQVIAGFSYYV